MIYFYDPLNLIKFCDINFNIESSRTCAHENVARNTGNL